MQTSSRPWFLSVLAAVTLPACGMQDAGGEADAEIDDTADTAQALSSDLAAFKSKLPAGLKIVPGAVVLG